MGTKKIKNDGAERTPTVSAEEFVVAWQAAENLAAAKETLGAGASSRAQRMRKAGVKLKKFPSSRAPIDVKALNALIKE